MARERLRTAGELVAFQTTLIRLAVWGTDKLPDLAELNPYRVEEPKSAALRELEAWQRRRRWRAAFAPNGEGN